MHQEQRQMERSVNALADVAGHYQYWRSVQKSIAATDFEMPASLNPIAPVPLATLHSFDYHYKTRRQRIDGRGRLQRGSVVACLKIAKRTP